MSYRLLVRIIALKVLILIILLPVAWADPVSPVGVAAADLDGTLNIVVYNIGASTITANVTDITGVICSESSAAVFNTWNCTLSAGRNTLMVWQNGGEIYREDFTGGSIFDSGFRAVYMDNVGRDLVAAVIIFAFALVCTGLGRWAGLPIFTAATTIIATYEYGASWISILPIMAAVGFFSLFLWELFGGESR